MTEFMQFLIIGISTGSIYGLIALGFVLVYKATRVFNFAQGDLMMVGAFMLILFGPVLGLNTWLSMAIAVAERGRDRAHLPARLRAPAARARLPRDRDGDDRRLARSSSRSCR